MTRRVVTVLALSLLFTSFYPLPASAAEREEFERILHLRMPDLTEESMALLEKKYPDENWDAWKFPRYVFTSDPIETGYRIAVKEPDLLSRIPCYCFCDAMGHRHLLHCFLKDNGKFDDHAVSCNICFGQAMLAFLWQEAGAGEAEILSGMERKFERLVKEQGKSPQVGH